MGEGGNPHHPPSRFSPPVTPNDLSNASHCLSRLISGYYLPRAERCIAAAKAAASKGQAFTKAARDQIWADVSFAFQVDVGAAGGAAYPSQPTGDALAASMAMRRRYAGKYLQKCGA